MEAGIKIHTDNADKSNLLLVGKFTLPIGYVKKKNYQPQKSLLLVITGHDYEYVGNIYKDKIFFMDELKIDDKQGEGEINIAVNNYIDFGVAEFNVMISMGPYTSNMLRVKI